MAEASEVSGLARSYSSGIAVGRCGRARRATASCACGRVRSQRRCRFASCNLQPSSQLSETIRRERVREASRESANVSIEVIKTTSANSSNIHQRGSRQNICAVSCQSESLVAKSSGDGKDVGACSCVEGLGVAARLNSESTGRLKKGNNIDGITQSLVTIRAAQGIGRIAVKAVQVSTVPVNNLILGDVVGNIGVTILIGGNKRLGKIQEAVMRHIVGPLRRAIIAMLRAKRSDVVRLAIIIPSDNLDHGKALLNDLVPTGEEQITRGKDPVLARKVGREPGRDGSEISLSVEPALVAGIAFGNGDIDAVRGSSVVAVAVPALLEK